MWADSSTIITVSWRHTVSVQARHGRSGELTPQSPRGISYTKCDNMASLDNLASAVELASIEPNEVLGAGVSVQSIRPAYKNAIIAAAGRHFGGTGTGGRVIFCMEMSPRVLLGEEIGMPPRPTEERFVLRNSDDYFPGQPDSHRYHIFTNAVNATFTSQLNVVPDLDMVSRHTGRTPDLDARRSSNLTLTSAPGRKGRTQRRQTPTRK
jgi:hypothetical protein